MSYNGPKAKLSRRLGTALTPKSARVMERKPYGPGQHGQRRRRRPSSYSQQLLEKQRLKGQYNLSERYLRKMLKRATQAKGNTGDNLVGMLETRIDALVLRSGIAQTIYQARQFVAHGHILLNDKRCTIPSHQVREGDVIHVRQGSRQIPAFNQPRTAAVPGYIDLTEDGYGATLSREPQRDEIPVLCDVQLVIEFYSR